MSIDTEYHAGRGHADSYSALSLVLGLLCSLGTLSARRRRGRAVARLLRRPAHTRQVLDLLKLPLLWDSIGAPPDGPLNDFLGIIGVVDQSCRYRAVSVLAPP